MEQLARLILGLLAIGVIVSMVKAGSPQGGVDWMRAKFLGKAPAKKAAR